MSDDIKPALTPEEWARRGFNHRALDAERFRDLFVGKPTGNLGVRIKSDLLGELTYSTVTVDVRHTRNGEPV